MPILWKHRVCLFSLLRFFDKLFNVIIDDQFLMFYKDYTFEIWKNNIACQLQIRNAVTSLKTSYKWGKVWHFWQSRLYVIKALKIRNFLMDRYLVAIHWLSEAFGGNRIWNFDKPTDGTTIVTYLDKGEKLSLISKIRR